MLKYFLYMLLKCIWGGSEGKVGGSNPLSGTKLHGLILEGPLGYSSTGLREFISFQGLYPPGCLKIRFLEKGLKKNQNMKQK